MMDVDGFFAWLIQWLMRYFMIRDGQLATCDVFFRGIFHGRLNMVEPTIFCYTIGKLKPGND